MPLYTTRPPTRLALALSSLSLALLLVFMAMPAGAQSVLLDEGSFRIRIAGRDVGSENFSIQQTGTAANMVINARGNVTIDSAGTTEELHSALQVAGASMQPVVYNLRIISDKREEQIAGRIVAGRFSAKIVSPTGEELREYLTSDRALLIDQGIVHQHYFLARRAQDDSLRIPVIIPRQSRQVSTLMESRGQETISVGNQRIAARHLVITPTGGNEVNLWVDDQARVLRLEIAALDLVASRTTPPR